MPCLHWLGLSVWKGDATVVGGWLSPLFGAVAEVASQPRKTPLLTTPPLANNKRGAHQHLLTGVLESQRKRRKPATTWRPPPSHFRPKGTDACAWLRRHPHWTPVCPMPPTQPTSLEAPYVRHAEIIWRLVLPRQWRPMTACYYIHVVDEALMKNVFTGHQYMFNTNITHAGNLPCWCNPRN